MLAVIPARTWREWLAFMSFEIDTAEMWDYRFGILAMLTHNAHFQGRQKTAADFFPSLKELYGAEENDAIALQAWARAWTLEQGGVVIDPAADKKAASNPEDSSRQAAKAEEQTSFQR